MTRYRLAMLAVVAAVVAAPFSGAQPLRPIEMPNNEIADIKARAEARLGELSDKHNALSAGDAQGEADKALIEQIGLDIELIRFAREAADYMTKDTKIFMLEHAKAEDVIPMISMLDMDVAASADLNAITVVGPAGSMAAVDAMVKALDAPRETVDENRNVELTMYLIEGGPETPDAAAPLPDALLNVAAQLERTFPYQRYHLIDTLWLRARENSSPSSAGVLPSDGEGKRSYEVRIDQVRVNGSADQTRIQLDEFSFGTEYEQPVSLPKSPQGPVVVRQTGQHETGIMADVDLKVGQAVVVGKSNFTGGEKALFIVITGQLAE